MLRQYLGLNWSIYRNTATSVTYINFVEPDRALTKGNVIWLPTDTRNSSSQRNLQNWPIGKAQASLDASPENRKH